MEIFPPYFLTKLKILGRVIDCPEELYEVAHNMFGAHKFEYQEDKVEPFAAFDIGTSILSNATQLLSSSENTGEKGLRYVPWDATPGHSSLPLCMIRGVPTGSAD